MTLEAGTSAPTLAQRAIELLSHPETVAPALRDGRPLLHVWHHDWRAGYRSWLLWTGRKPKETLLKVRRVVWLRPTLVASARAGAGGPERDATTEPELSVTDADVPSAQWQQLLEEAEGLRVPALQFGDSRVGTDGAVYGVEQKSFHRTLRFEWWWKPPAGWEELADWVSRVTAFFEANLGGPSSADEPRPVPQSPRK